MLKKIIDSPVLKLLVGIILLYTSGAEVWHQYQESKEVVVGAHHGIVVFALVHILKTLPDIMEGFEDIGISRNGNE